MTHSVLGRSSTRIKKAAVLVLLLLVGVIGGASHAGGQEDRGAQARADRGKDEEKPWLPEGEGRALLFQACVQCHDLRNIVTQRKTAAGWRRTVNEMIWRGAPLMTDEVEVLANYLAASFGPDVPIPDAIQRTVGDGRDKDEWSHYLPEGRGRTLVLQACVQCHDLRNIVAQRKTAADWQRTVNEMIRLGTQLTAREAEIVTKYLAASLGR